VALRIGELAHRTGNTLAAATGASTKELMARRGPASPRAALLYQHATRDRDVVFAKALDDTSSTGSGIDRLESGPVRVSSAEICGSSVCRRPLFMQVRTLKCR
jgi:hypothetical protein